VVKISTSKLTNLTSNLATKSKTNLALVHQFVIALVARFKISTHSSAAAVQNKQNELMPLPLQQYF
jgi:hypothetical protein